MKVVYVAMASTKDNILTGDMKDSISEAEKTFEIWEKKYTLIQCWVQVFVDGESKEHLDCERKWIVTTPTQINCVNCSDCCEGTEKHNDKNNKKKEITLYDVIEASRPSCLSDEHDGGVVGCPSDYIEFGFDDSYNACNDDVEHYSCYDCWRQAYETQEY